MREPEVRDLTHYATCGNWAGAVLAYCPQLDSGGVGWLVTRLIITFSEFPVPLILLRQHVKQRPGLQLGYVAQLPGLAEIFFRIFTYKDK